MTSILGHGKERFPQDWPVILRGGSEKAALKEPRRQVPHLELSGVTRKQ